MVTTRRKFKPTRRMQFRRREEGKTDYRKRLSLLRSGKPRLVVRHSLKCIRVQLMGFDSIGDKTIVMATSQMLRPLGWGFATDNLPAAYLTGFIAGKLAKVAGVKEAHLDIGLYPSTKGSRMYAAAKGAIDAGLAVPVDDKMVPESSRLRGEHIAGHMEKFKDMPKKFDEMISKVEKEDFAKARDAKKEGKSGAKVQKPQPAKK
jgi:large subunit ribosomal protein L18